MDLYVNEDGGTLKLVVASGQRNVSVTRGDACHGNGARANEVVLVDQVFVHHVHSEKSHFWEGHLEGKGLLPFWVEPCKGDKINGIMPVY